MPHSDDATLLETLLELSPPERSDDRPAGPPECLLGRCARDRHPTLQGRVEVTWEHEGREETAWLPVLQSVTVRTGDRVLVQRVANWREPVVTGVVDGFARRPDPAKRVAAALDLEADEVMEIRGPDGTPLAELRAGPEGPVLQVVSDDLDLDVPGRLHLRAGALHLEAREGSVEIRAGDDVVVKGEVIHLN
jgi:hypothetical protein